MKNTNLPFDVSGQTPAARPVMPWERKLATGERELAYGAVTVLLAILLCNCVIAGGLNLGFAVMTLACIAATAVYLRRSGKTFSGYAAALLILSAVTAASFIRSNDYFVKFVMVCFLLAAVNLSLALAAGRNRRSPNGAGSLLDVLSVIFMLGLGRLGEAWRGLGDGLKNLSGRSKTLGAVLLGLLIAVPVLAIMIPLLISADAAFDGLIALLPDFDFAELVASVIFGFLLAMWMYTRSAALIHAEEEPGEKKVRKGLNKATIITVMGAVCLLYTVYLFSQLAYFSGGFSGILPDGYSAAQYARRGFFEMAWLCAIDLGLIALSIGLVKTEGKAPLALRIECLFVGLVTLFFVVSASAKMFLYIGTYGLTRLRVLTEVIMVFLGLTTGLVCLWLFLPKLPYMKVVMIAGLVMGAAVAWVDVDTVVAAYNVHAYQSGKLETVDVRYLATLSDGAVPYLEELTQDSDPSVAAKAENYLAARASGIEDIRGWTIAGAQAQKILEKYASDSDNPYPENSAVY